MPIFLGRYNAFNDETKHMDLWNYIVERSKSFNLLWIVVGDFNSIISSNDRINNGLYNSMGDQDFIDCISSSKLMEPDFTGNYFTWQVGLNFFIHSKIDRVFVNNLWLDVFSQFGVFVNHSISDHFPINIKLMVHNKKKCRVPFRYNNSWHLQTGYHSSL